MSNMNETKSKNWTKIQTEINQYPNDFFILIQDQAITRAYSIWKHPAEMPCKNLLDRYRMILSQKTYVERYYEVVKQYPNRKRDSNIFLVGDSIRFFQTAYPNLKLSPPLPGFKSMNVRRVER
jgi:hypothetical protein